MKIGLTFISKLIVWLMFLAVVSVCGVLLPELAREEAVGNPNAGSPYPYLIGAWVVAIPIFVALQQALQFLSYIDGNTAFSERSVKTLHNIKICTIVFTALIVVGAITIILIGRSVGEDVTPFITLGFVFTLVSSIIATFVSVLKRLLQNAIDIKFENDQIV